MGVVVAVGWVVAGCTGGDDPGPSPSVDEPVVPSPSESESPEPSPTETGPVKPERPATMDRDDAEGAAAAAEYFLELYPYVMATGDTAEWDAMTWADTCGFCSSVSEDARSISQDGHTFAGGAVTAELEKSWPLDELIGGYPVDLNATMQEGQVIDAGGTVLREIDGFEGVMELGLLHDQTGWRVLAVSVKGES
ncbi:DUF6318 family protein [Cellulosimicrobium sp. SH8]|uniref:DUF6318 family protein n=1 Tax=Cellulosimicrobium sp. SH8 TaxID=2952936 RepID=UPI0021F2D4A7|nr:DUF6318 family protein [Cellulosimicrobium sp. SH8]